MSEQAIEQYRAAKDDMKKIIDRHMSEAFSEIREAYGTTPVSVYINVNSEQVIGRKYPNGFYAGSEVQLAGD